MVCFPSNYIQDIFQRISLSFLLHDIHAPLVSFSTSHKHNKLYIYYQIHSYIIFYIMCQTDHPYCILRMSGNRLQAQRLAFMPVKFRPFYRSLRKDSERPRIRLRYFHSTKYISIYRFQSSNSYTKTNIGTFHNSLIKTIHRLFYLKTQFVRRSKHFSSRL